MLSFTRLNDSFRYAGDGFKFAWQNDQNLRIHFVIAILVIVLGLILGVSRIEFLILLMAILLVIWAEMINTVVEKTVDLITTERHQSAKIAKDVSSAMVLMTSVGAVIVGVVIFLPYIF
jgi:diacylglycerol kinase (ATP)